MMLAVMAADPETISFPMVSPSPFLESFLTTIIFPSSVLRTCSTSFGVKDLSSLEDSSDSSGWSDSDRVPSLVSDADGSMSSELGKSESVPSPMMSDTSFG